MLVCFCLLNDTGIKNSCPYLKNKSHLIDYLMIRSIEIRVFGKVQGVFYRQNTINKAFELGLIGHVQNMEDGTVLIRAQGESKDVDTLVEWCHRGPQEAEVSEVKVLEVALQDFSGFIILR